VVGEEVPTDDWTFTVVAMDRRRIETVQVVRPPTLLDDGAASS
jgi:CBS domain containing-hemolysin-like protein